MNKRQTDLDAIEKFKNRFRKLDNERIKKRLTESTLSKDAEIALKEVLKERHANNAR